MTENPQARPPRRWVVTLTYLAVAVVLGGLLLTTLQDSNRELRASESALEKRIRKDDRPKAPEFTPGLAWINTAGGKALTMADLKGKIVLLDFWTFG